MNVHVEVFTDELTFYQLGSDVIHQFRVDEGLVDAAAKPLPSNSFQRAVWTLLENPESSLAARIIAILSISVIVLSIATFCLETLPELKRYQRVSVNETTAVGTTDDVGLVRSSAREVDDRVRTNEPIFRGLPSGTIWNGSSKHMSTSRYGLDCFGVDTGERSGTNPSATRSVCTG